MLRQLLHLKNVMYLTNGGMMISDQLERQLIEARMTNSIIHGFLTGVNRGQMERDEALARIVLALHSQNADLVNRILRLTEQGIPSVVLDISDAAKGEIVQKLLNVTELNDTIKRLRSELDDEKARTICLLCGEELTRMANNQVTIPTPSAEIVITRTIGGTDRSLDITCTSDDARAWLESVAPIYGQLIAPLSKFNAYRLIVSAAYHVDDVEKFLKAQGK